MSQLISTNLNTKLLIFHHQISSNKNHQPKNKNQMNVTHGDRRTGVEYALPPDQPFCTVHSNGTDHVLPQVLGHLQHQPDRVVQHLQRREDRGKPFLESHIHHSTDHLAHLPDRSSSSELVSNLAPLPGFLWRSRRRRRSSRGSRGRVLRQAREDVAIRRRAVWGRWGCKSRARAGDRGSGRGTPC